MPKAMNFPLPFPLPKVWLYFAEVDAGGRKRQSQILEGPKECWCHDISIIKEVYTTVFNVFTDFNLENIDDFLNQGFGFEGWEFNISPPHFTMN